MAKHIIDTESSEFDGIPMRLRESCKGQILLAEDRREDGSLRGLITIEPESLAETITADTGAPPQYIGKTIEEYLADDVGADDISGHKKYARIHEELIDDDFVKILLQAKGLNVAAIATLRAKFMNVRIAEELK